MNPVSEDIKDLLESSSVALGTFGTDLFIDMFPDAPDLCICIKDTGGLQPETNYALNYPSFQILVRGTPSGYLTAYTKIESIFNELHRKTNFTQGGASYRSIAAVAEPACIGRDNSNRPIFSVNFNVMRKSSS